MRIQVRASNQTKGLEWEWKRLFCSLNSPRNYRILRTNCKGSRLEITERKITIHIDFINNGSEKRETFLALSRKCGSEGGYTVNLLHVRSRGLPTSFPGFCPTRPIPYLSLRRAGRREPWERGWGAYKSWFEILNAKHSLLHSMYKIW